MWDLHEKRHRQAPRDLSRGYGVRQDGNAGGGGEA